MKLGESDTSWASSYYVTRRSTTGIFRPYSNLSPSLFETNLSGKIILMSAIRRQKWAKEKS